MRKAGLIALGLLLFAGLASAQVPTHGNVFFGYSYYNTDVTSVGSANTNGWRRRWKAKSFLGLGWWPILTAITARRIFVWLARPASTVQEPNIRTLRNIIFFLGQEFQFRWGSFGPSPKHCSEEPMST